MLATGFGLLALAALSNSYTSRRLPHTYAAVAQSHQVRVGLTRLLAAVQDVQMGQRGYVLTANKQFLVPYTYGVQQTEFHFNRLLRLTQDNSSHQSRLNALKPLIDQKLTHARDIIALRDTKGFEAAQREVAAGNGQAMTDTIRLALQDIDQAEGAVLVKRSQAASKASDINNFAVMTSSGLSFVLLVIAGFFLWRLNSRCRMADNAMLLADTLAAKPAVEPSHQKTSEQRSERRVPEEPTRWVSHATPKSTPAPSPAKTPEPSPKPKFQTAAATVPAKSPQPTPAKAPEPPLKVSALAAVVQAQQPFAATIEERLAGTTFAKPATPTSTPAQAPQTAPKTGTTFFERRPLTLNDVIEQAVAALKPAATLQQINLGLQLASNLPELRFDHHRITEVLNHLLTNALKHTSFGGNILVISRLASPDLVQVSVTDNGAGISVEQCARIFERDEHKTGLNTCREIIQQQGGKIWVLSERGKGSTFTFSLPTAAATPAVGAPQIATAPAKTEQPAISNADAAEVEDIIQNLPWNKNKAA